MKTRVVHINSPEWAKAVKDGTAVYIGRANPRAGLTGSKYANRWRVHKSMGRDFVIERHELDLRVQCWRYPQTITDIRTELGGRVLGCWCKAYKPGQSDKRCHGDILAMLADSGDAEYRDWLDLAPYAKVQPGGALS